MGIRERVAAARASSAVLGAFILVPLQSAVAANLVIMADQGSVPETRALAEAFSRASGHTVTVVQETGAAQQRRIDSGPADVMTGDPERLATLARNGKLLADSTTPFRLASLGVSVRAGAPKPDIGTVDAYKAALIAAKSIGYSFGCSGLHVAEGIEQLGLTEALKAKTVRTGSQGAGGPVTDYLARGDVELGIQQSNIMIGVPGTDYVGIPPGFLNKPCRSDLAVLAVSKQMDAARALVRFMVSPEALPVMRAAHVEPIKP
jgi:molybdate transport system substrate-binding protein